MCLGTSFGARGSHRMLMWVKARVSPSTEGRSMTADWISKRTRALRYAELNVPEFGSCRMIWSRTAMVVAPGSD
jgi:hypothetical protein